MELILRMECNKLTFLAGLNITYLQETWNLENVYSNFDISAPSWKMVKYIPTLIRKKSIWILCVNVLDVVCLMYDLLVMLYNHILSISQPLMGFIIELIIFGDLNDKIGGGF